MLAAGCCGDPATMFANDWDGAADLVFKADTSNYMMIGMWNNARAKNDYALTEGKDYGIFQFPALGMGHDDTSSVDTKELNVTANGANPKVADAFLDFIVSADAANLMAGYGYASSSHRQPTTRCSARCSRRRPRPSPVPRCSSCSATCSPAISSMNIACSCRSSCRTPLTPISTP